jgi:DNA-directed RNA polymerase specialized sigma subunit
VTEREQEVLKMLLASDEEVQEIANRLYISRAMLYRYISSLNKKRLPDHAPYVSFKPPISIPGIY